MEAEYLQYITPDGLVYEFDTGKRWLMTEEEGTGLPDINYITQRGPFQHGNTVIDYRLEPRVVQLVLREDSCNRFEYWSSRRMLLNMIRPNRITRTSSNTGVLRKYFPDGTKLDLDVVIEKGPTFTAKGGKWDEWAYQETLRFIANNPIYYDPIPVCLTWPIAGIDQLVFPITFPIVFGGSFINETATVVYPGTWLSYPTIEITGPMQGILISNDTTGKFIHLLHDVSVGEVVTIYLPYGNKRVVSSILGDLTGTITDDSDTVLFYLAPDPEAAGGVNFITVQGINIDPGVTVVRIIYNVRYIGY